MSDTENNVWPTPDSPTIITPRDTVVGAPPPPLATEPDLPPDRRIGLGMLLAILVVLLVAVAIVVALLLRHHNSSSPTTTVVVTSGSPPPTGVARVAVPGLTGESLADARASLRQLGLTATVRQVASTQTPGTVVAQVPASGQKLAKAGVVSLSVAQAAPTTPAPTTTAAPAPQPQTAAMPDVTGQSEAAAVQALNQAGTLASLVFVPNADTLGTVEGQAKPAGTQLPARTHVQLNISTGPGTKTEESVPNVIGQTLTAAVPAMQGAHLRLIYVRLPVSAQSQAGKIVQQSPLGGSHAPQNAQVLVFLGAFKG